MAGDARIGRHVRRSRRLLAGAPMGLGRIDGAQPGSASTWFSMNSTASSRCCVARLIISPLTPTKGAAVAGPTRNAGRAEVDAARLRFTQAHGPLIIIATRPGGHRRFHFGGAAGGHAPLAEHALEQLAAGHQRAGVAPPGVARIEGAAGPWLEGSRHARPAAAR